MEDLRRAPGTDERVWVWVTTYTDPTSYGSPKWSFTATNATSPGTMYTGSWDSDGWSDATGRIKAWSPRLASDCLTTASGTYQPWVRFSTANSEQPLLKTSYYLILS